MKTAELKYLPLKWLVHALAWLPLWVLYRLADLLFLLLFYIVGYRKKTVFKNLTESFPEKTQAEIQKIAREFYRNFADYIVETIKLLHISDKQMRGRMTFSGVEIIDEAVAQGRPVVCYFAHLGNWEWAPSITLWSRFTPHEGVEFCQIYRPLRNRWFDSLMLQIRGRFGAVSLPKKRSFLDLLRYRKRNIPTVTGFMSDQKPSHGDPIHILPFLNHPTAMITGTETVCRRLDALPVYWEMTKPRRGRYHISVLPMLLPPPSPRPSAPVPHPSGCGSPSPFPLTDLYASLLEANIRRAPSLWLWSHKRWKIPVSYPAVNPSE